MAADRYPDAGHGALADAEIVALKRQAAPLLAAALVVAALLPAGAVAQARRPNVHLIALDDIYPTLSELAGLPAPGGLQGTNAVPLLSAPGRTWKGAVFSQFLRSGIWVAHDSIPYMGYSMVTPDYHYVAWMNWNTRSWVAWELYDRRKDPDEDVNLAVRPEYASLLARLERERVSGWRAARPGSAR